MLQPLSPGESGARQPPPAVSNAQVCALLCSLKNARATAIAAKGLETRQRPWRRDKEVFGAAKRNAFRSLKMRSEAKHSIHGSPVSIRLEPVDNHERRPNRSVRMALNHAFENLATNLGTRLRGIKRCANTLNLLRTPGTVRPPPLASIRSASSTTSSGL
jgi:hypothetical protein